MKYELDDFIGIFDGAFTNTCDKYLDFFKSLDSKGLTTPRKFHSHEVGDKSVSLMSESFAYPHEYNINQSHDIIKEFDDIYWARCQPEYTKKYSILEASCRHQILEAKIQKTCPGEGYHTWHYESGKMGLRNRILTWMLYLNDDYEGGETEFLYQHRRIQPKKDRLLIWPAHFTHTHRGGQVLSGEKYVITGWVEFTGNDP